MPYGVLADICSIVFSSIIGSIIGKRLSDKFKMELNSAIGVWSCALGIALLPKMQIFGAVALSFYLSYVIGYALDFDGHVNNLVLKSTKKLFKDSDNLDTSSMSVLIVLLAFGGSGIVGAMTEALNGDNSIIIARAVSDLVTVSMFGATLGLAAILSAIPCAISLLFFFFCAKIIMPLMTDTVYANFVASGGVLSLLSGLRLLKVVKAKPMNAILSIFLVVPITILWQRVIG